MSTHATTRSPSDDDAQIPDHSTIELRVRPRPDGPVRIDEVVDVLRGGRVVAAVVDGSASGDGCVVAVLAAGEDERVLISSAGDLQPGPRFEDVARQLAHATGCDVLVDWVAVVTPDGSHRMVDDLPILPEVERTLVAWRATTASPMVVRALALMAGVPVVHATVDGWTVVALPIDAPALSLGDLPVGGGDLPVVELARHGGARQVRWYDRRRLAPVTGQVGVGPRTTSVLDDPAGTPASRLAAELGSTGYRDVPETGRVDAASRAALESLPLVPETLLADAAAALGIPAGLAELVEDVDQEPAAAPGRWLTAPGAEQVEPESSTGGAISRGIYAILTEEPQGDGRYARYRRWLWHRPGVLVAVSASEAAAGAALCVAAASGVSIGGVVWPLWAAGALVLLDAAPDLANGILLLRLRAKARPRPAA